MLTTSTALFSCGETASGWGGGGLRVGGGGLGMGGGGKEAKEKI